MSSLSPLEQLALNAFAAALDTCHEEGIELPEEIRVLKNNLEQHVGELGAIAQTHPQFNAFYRNARNVLRRASGDGDRFLPRSDAAPRQTVPAPIVQTQTPTNPSEGDLRNLKRVGAFWVVRAVHQANADWDHLVQGDRDSRLNTLMGLGIAES
ncbi:MAG: hypothetical protein HC771_10820 [Synechococcales cyanobacterium CRU_2_2]|nr:hypothetical protein [Synechococcales cyanobacterium CRU_2_2]